jgi:hypothetical protein
LRHPVDLEGSELGNRIGQINQHRYVGGDRAADAPIGEFHDAVLGAALDAAVLQEVLAAGIRRNDDGIVAQVVATVAFRYMDGTPSLIEMILLPAIEYFTEKGDARWVNVVWYLSKERSPLANLTAEQVAVVLKNLLHLPRVESHAERILVLLAAKYPEKVFNFFADRKAFSATRDEQGQYEAIPYQFHGLEKSFASIADHAVDTVRRWFISGDPLFQFTAGRLLSISFPDFPDSLKVNLSSYIRPNNRDDIEFVVCVLYHFHIKMTWLCKGMRRWI